MQGGGLKQLGILKPWAPTRSYGLVVRRDAEGEPRASFHSRADGRRHGITSCVEADGRSAGDCKGRRCDRGDPAVECGVGARTVAALIEMRNVTKEYRGVAAVRNVTSPSKRAKSMRWWVKTAPESRR